MKNIYPLLSLFLLLLFSVGCEPGTSGTSEFTVDGVLIKTISDRESNVQLILFIHGDSTLVARPIEKMNDVVVSATLKECLAGCGKSGSVLNCFRRCKAIYKVFEFAEFSVE